MTKPMNRRKVEQALAADACSLLRSTGGHDVYGCPCGQHMAPLPRHREISPGVVKSIGKLMACLPEGWL